MKEFKTYVEAKKTQKQCSNFLIIVFAFMIVLSLGACGKKGDSGNSPQNEDGIWPQARPPLEQLQVDELSPGGCLDLVVLEEQLHEVLESRKLVSYSRSVQIRPLPPSGEDNEQPSPAPREKLIAVMSRGLFDHSQSKAAQPQGILEGVHQEACRKVILNPSERGPIIYKVVEADDRQITLEDDEGSKIRFEILSPNQIAITEEFRAMDFCPPFDEFLVAHTYHNQIYKASQPADALRVEEDLLRALFLYAQDVPEDFSHLSSDEVLDLSRHRPRLFSSLSEEEPTDEVESELSLEDLERLSQVKLRPEAHRCYFPQEGRGNIVETPDGEQPEQPVPEEGTPEGEEERNDRASDGESDGEAELDSEEGPNEVGTSDPNPSGPHGGAPELETDGGL